MIDQPTNSVGEPIQCAWFARCPNDAVGRVAHPILGLVPTCLRCADKLDLTFATTPGATT